MASLGNWLAYMRQALELLYYLSGIAIAVAAFWGLKQLTITRQIARMNAKRESYKLAADECRHFAIDVVPLRPALENQIKDKNLQSFKDRHFVVEQGEIAKHDFDLTLLRKEMPEIAHELVAYLNAAEAFAIFFASGVAAEEIGYRETGTAFCEAATRHMPAIFFMRSINIRYESIIRLFEIWHGRREAEKISKQMKALEDAAKHLSKETIRPLSA